MSKSSNFRVGSFEKTWFGGDWKGALSCVQTEEERSGAWGSLGIQVGGGILGLETTDLQTKARSGCSSAGFCHLERGETGPARCTEQKASRTHCSDLQLHTRQCP